MMKRSAIAAFAVAAAVVAGVGAPSQGQSAIDDFERTVTNGWGKSSSGPTWEPNRAGDFAVSGGRGRIVAPPGQQRFALLPTRQTEVKTTVRVDKLSGTGSGLYLAPMLNVVDGKYLQPRVRLTPTGAVRLSLRTVSASNSVSTLTNDYVAPFNVSAASEFQLRVKVSGTNQTTLSAKVWQGSNEPAEWQRTATVGQTNKGDMGWWTYASASGGTGQISIAAITNSSTPAPPPPPPPSATSVAEDDFRRTVGSGWGSAPIGGAYSPNKSSGFSVSDSVGWLRVQPGQQRITRLPDVSKTDVTSVVLLHVREIANKGTGVYAGPTIRHQASGERIQARVRIMPDGQATLGLRDVLASGSTKSVGADYDLGNVSQGSKYWVRLSAVGNQAGMRIWAAGSPEPADFAVVGKTATLRSGSIGFWAYSSGSGAAGEFGVRDMTAQAETTPPVGDGTPPPPPPPPPPTGGDLDPPRGPHNTGVPSSVSLKRHNGDLNIRESGAVISGLDIHGFVAVEAPNVTIKNSVIRGGSTTRNRGLLKITHANSRNFRLVDSEIRPNKPSPYLDALKTNTKTTLERVDISGTVDGIVILGDDITVKDSYLHGFRHYQNDPQWNGGPSHDDAIQIEGGRDIVLEGNTIEGAYNAALMITQNYSTTSNVRVTNNWFDDGGCSIHIIKKSRPYMNGLRINNNVFGGHQRVANCAVFFDPRHSDLNPTGNKWATGKPAGIVRYP